MRALVALDLSGVLLIDTSTVETTGMGETGGVDRTAVILVPPGVPCDSGLIRTRG